MSCWYNSRAIDAVCFCFILCDYCTLVVTFDSHSKFVFMQVQLDAMEAVTENLTDTVALVAKPYTQLQVQSTQTISYDALFVNAFVCVHFIRK